MVFPVYAQTAVLEETPDLDKTDEISHEETEEISKEETEVAKSKFLRLFSEERRPLVASDNLIFGFPEFLNFNFGFDLGFDEVFWIGLGFKGDYTAGPFSFVADIHFLNDQKYAPAAALTPSGSLGAFYFMLLEGGLIFEKGPFELAAGRFRNYDEIDSPYTLYLNSKGIPANTMKFRWESNFFIYQSQWIGLNWNNSASSPAWNEYQRRKETGDFYTDSGVPRHDTKGISYGFPDRGVVYKIYALKVKDWRVGFLDAVSYSGRYLDAEYFLSPIPMYFTQYFKATPGRPWATDQNDNCLMGLFWDLKKPAWDAYVQVLVDDFSLRFMRWFYHGFDQNPWKAAWTLGGRIYTDIGRFGFHHGGALKYTFEPIGADSWGKYKNDSANTAYGYTYYPETRFFDDDDGSWVSLALEDMMVGYKYGQNNLAFQADYQNRFSNYLVTAELELVLAGNNSPANPWHDYDTRSNMYNYGYVGSQLFNDGKIEKRLEFRVNVTRRFGPMAVYAAMAIGGRFNKLELRSPEPDIYSSKSPDRTIDNEIWIWKASDSHELIIRFSIGFRYTVPVI